MQAMTENHAVTVKINDCLKHDNKIIKLGKVVTLKCDIALENLGLNNTLTLVDETESESRLLIFSIQMKVSLKKK